MAYLNNFVTQTDIVLDQNPMTENSIIKKLYPDIEGVQQFFDDLEMEDQGFEPSNYG